MGFVIVQKSQSDKRDTAIRPTKLLVPKRYATFFVCPFIVSVCPFIVSLY